jgi:hypothetical protein
MVRPRRETSRGLRKEQGLEAGETDGIRSFDRQAVDTLKKGPVLRPKIAPFQCGKA